MTVEEFEQAKQKLLLEQQGKRNSIERLEKTRRNLIADHYNREGRIVDLIRTTSNFTYRGDFERKHIIDIPCTISPFEVIDYFNRRSETLLGNTVIQKSSLDAQLNRGLHNYRGLTFSHNTNVTTGSVYYTFTNLYGKSLRSDLPLIEVVTEAEIQAEYVYNVANQTINCTLFHLQSSR